MKHFTLLCFFLIATSLLAQRGPGGVTVDTDSQKNCRLWLDAGDLKTLGDGDPVNVWHDKSLTAITVDDSAYWDPADIAHYLQPIYRDAPSASINGKPVVSYEDGGMLKIGNWDGNNGPPASPDLNLNTSGYQTTYEQTVFVAFRTGNDVTSNQTLWEEGGSNRGFKIYLRDDSAFIAAYDDIGTDNDPRVSGVNRVPAFGFSYKGHPIQPNSTYVLSLVYNVPKGQNTTDGNKLITNNFNPNPAVYTGLTGTLNGDPFQDSLQYFKNAGPGVGGVSYHPDPIGVGGMNRTSYDENGRLTESNVNSDPRLFQGRLAELCYYAYAMNDAERIIVENYLAAKYFANVIFNDKYDYEAGYGDGVIGVGQEVNGVDHNISQGDNLFQISVNMGQAFPSNAPYYLLVGHNNASIDWTKQNTPDSASIRRLQRIWRWDRKKPSFPPLNYKKVTIKLYPQDIAKLPPLPTGYTKYGILQEHTSTYLPNFSPANSTVTELLLDTIAGPFYRALVNIEKGEFFTLCAIKPTAQFEGFSDYAIEGDPAPADFPRRAKLVLNYKPTSTATTTVGVKFIDVTASTGIDYDHATPDSATFAVTRDTTSVGFKIINNDTITLPPTKNFKIILIPAVSSPGVYIGGRDTLDFSIYDDDPDPKITFAVSDTSISEDAGLGRIRVQVLGTTNVPTTAQVIRPNISVSGTATYNLDYSLPPENNWSAYGGTMRTTVTIPAGTNQTASVFFPILPDSLDEYDETINFSIQPLTGIGVGSGSILNHTVTITDEDGEPTVSFATATFEGYEAINNPRIYFILNTPSGKEVTVNYDYVGGTATPSPGTNSDFSVATTGTVVFPPGSVEQYISLIVYSNDSTPETDNTVIFDINSPVNATLGTPLEYTYTIKDYTEFEWLGVAGVGKFPDNTFWMVPDAATSGPASSIPNQSPRPVNLIQDISTKRPTVTTAALGLNNHKMVTFDGSDNIKVGGPGSNADAQGQSPLINTGGQYDRKSIFFVFSPDNVSSAIPQVIYEEGGGSNGLSIYMIQNKLYFYIWVKNASEYSPWGFVGNTSNDHTLGQAYVTSSTDLVAGQSYIVSCIYVRNWLGPDEIMPPLAGMHMYINGVLEDSYTTDSGGQYRVGRMLAHTGYASIGAMWYQGKLHTITDYGPLGKADMNYYFHGKIGEFLYFNEPSMTEARVRIVNNYLASKYNIPFTGGTQDFNLAYADNTPSATNTAFNYQMAGIGKEGGSIHGDAQGRGDTQTSELRVTNGTFVSDPAFLVWGNNGEDLTNTWPYSNDYLPAGILERSGKIWRFSANPIGSVTYADFLLRYTNAQNATAFSNDPSLLKLLVSTTSDPNDFSSATVYNVSQVNGGDIAQFNHIPITDGMYISLANTSAIYPLPIELLSFTAKLNGNFVDLNWATASETNNEYFQIERADSDLNWKEIGQVDGAGNSNTTLYYNEKDRDPLPGISYYRLKQVDYDGKYTYSDVVSVVNNHLSDEDQVFIYPNPNKNGELWLRIPYAFSDYVTTVTVYDLSGKIQLQSQLGLSEAISQINIESLSQGAYILHIRSAVIDESKKLIKY